VNPRDEREAAVARLVRLALDSGATAAEATAAGGEEFEVEVRLGAVEKLQEAGSSSASIRVLRGLQAGSAATSDLSDSGLAALVRRALSVAELSMQDPHAGLPDPAELGAHPGGLALFHPSVEAMPPAERIAWARRAEQAAHGFDPRITLSDGATFRATSGWRAFANSLGFLSSYRATSCAVSVSPVAMDGPRRERDFWSSASRSIQGLESPESVGREAAARLLRRLGARKLATEKMPVVFEPRAARTLIGHIFSAASGEAVWRNASFLAGKLGQPVASPPVTVYDDPLTPGRFGSLPFDAEGVRPRRKTLLKQGRLESYLLHTYTARKLGSRTTANAVRGTSGNCSTGHGALFLAPGSLSPSAIRKSLKRAFWVTELLGSGVNIVNGDYSRGAAGLLVENGEWCGAVSEVTIAANLAGMLSSIEAVGSDLEFRSAVASPTILIGEMTVSGRC
jgi:PmbA protein